MGWQDRNYGSGREQMNGFFSSPASLLQYSVPIYKSAGFYIRLHFWFLLFAVFTVIELLQRKQPQLIPLYLAIMLGAVLLHECGHRIFAKWVGGNHWEWVVWPLGGMIPPAVAQRPKSVFVANIGGVVMSLVLAGASYGSLFLIPHVSLETFFSWNPMGPVGIVTGYSGDVRGMGTLVDCLAFFSTSCFAITVINLFPAYWFDGGYIWQSILWPKLGQWKATTITCMGGMILSVPFFMLALWGRNLLGMIIWILIFSDCFNRRRMLKEAGPGVMDEGDSPAYNYMDTDTPKAKKKRSEKSLKNARKRVQEEREEQGKIDAILAKVKEKGLHSLTWFEKRTLRRATERQRERDMVRRR